MREYRLAGSRQDGRVRLAPVGRAPRRVSHVDLAHPKFRYATTSGAVALVAVPSTDGHKANIWGFVSAGCVQPDRKHGYSTVYFPRVVQVDHLPKNPVPSSDLHRYGCHGPVRSSTAPRLGWIWDPKNKPACPV